MLAQRPLAAVFIVACLFAGCGDPCNDLSKKVCKCKPTQVEQQACTQTIDTSSRPGASDAEKDHCSELLDTCTCDALKKGDLAACGLAEESDPAG